MNVDNTLQIVKTYLNNNATMPPMLIGYDQKNQPLALIGSFRDFQEQITFCAVAKLAFILNDVKRYHIITHGYMRDDLTKSDSTTTKLETTNQLIKFLGKNKSKKVEGDAEVLIDAFISDKGNTCSVHKLLRDNRGKLQKFELLVNFNASDLIQGMFTQLIPNKSETVSSRLRTEVESLIGRIQYDIPTVGSQESIRGLSKLWNKK